MNEVLQGLLGAAEARGVVAEVSVLRRRQQEMRARAGSLDTAVEATTTSAWLRVWANGGESTLTVTGSADPHQTIDLACTLARQLPPRSVLPPPTGLGGERRDHGDGTGDPEDGEPVERVGRRLADLARGDGEEVWVLDRDDRVSFGRTGEGALEHRRRLVAANVRVVAQGARGRAHASHGTGAPSAAALLEGPLPQALATAREEVAALSSAPPVDRLPGTVVLSPVVAASLLSLAVHGFLADAVLERHSMLADQLGEVVASDLVTIVDDATMPGAPLDAPVDDEGSRTVATTLVERGRLRGYLSDRRTAERLPGVAPGAGWSPQGDTPGPAPSNFCLLPDAPAVHAAGPVVRDLALEVVQSHGMHIANPVTGAFSFGGAGVVRQGGEVIGAVPHLTVAGNAYTLLRDVRGVGDDLRFVVSSAAFGSPSLEVGGLSIGR